MDQESGVLLGGLLLMAGLVVLVPSQSIALAIRLRRMRVPDDAPLVVTFWTRAVRPTSVPKLRALECLSVLLIGNGVALVTLLPLYGQPPNPLIAVFGIAYLVGEALWFWWLRQFIGSSPRD